MLVVRIVGIESTKGVHLIVKHYAVGPFDYFEHADSGIALAGINEGELAAFVHTKGLCGVAHGLEVVADE